MRPRVVYLFEFKLWNIEVQNWFRGIRLINNYRVWQNSPLDHAGTNQDK